MGNFCVSAHPRYVADYLALVGDDIDVVPGAKGIGPAGATELIKLFGSKENVLKSKSVVLLKTDLDLGLNLVF